LEIADKHLDGAPDTLLHLLVECKSDKSAVWLFIRRIRDKQLAATLVLKHLANWDVNVCLDLLFMCKCHLSIGAPAIAVSSTSECKAKEPNDLQNKIHVTLERMQTMKQILTCDSERWDCWQTIFNTCTQENPEIVIRRLVDKKQYNLARDVAAQYGSAVSEDVRVIIEESFLSHLLTVTMDYGAAIQSLVAMGFRSKSIVVTLLGKMSEFSTKLFLVQMMLTYLRSFLDEKEIRLYTCKEFGLQVLGRFEKKQKKHQADIFFLLSILKKYSLFCRMPAPFQAQYQHLVDQPMLIVESLLMSEHVLLAAHLFMQLPQLRQDETIIMYAKKSLRIPESATTDHKLQPHAQVATIEIEGVSADSPAADTFVTDGGGYDWHPSHKSLWCLTGNSDNDQSIRSQHSFVTAPSIHLARALLDLCGDTNASGKVNHFHSIAEFYFILFIHLFICFTFFCFQLL
jgi:hypothetical protein